MADVTLLIDQGNTRLKWVLARTAKLMSNSAGHGDLEVFMEACRRDASLHPASVLFSSVAGREDAQRWRIFVSPAGVSRRNCWNQPGNAVEFATHTANRECWVVDRWLAIVGAVARYGKPVVIWDLGTATTLDAVDETGQHLGGMIYPGPATMLNALSRDTKLRVPPNLEDSATAPGRVHQELHQQWRLRSSGGRAQPVPAQHF